MQNGCFCCTLQSDLVEQIVTLAEKKMFDYMLIEASGVSEPAQIAPMFDLCQGSIKAMSTGKRLGLNNNTKYAQPLLRLYAYI